MNLKGYATLLVLPTLLAGLAVPITTVQAGITDLLSAPAKAAINTGKTAVKVGNVTEQAYIPTKTPPSQKAENFLNGIAVQIARGLVQSMVNSTIKWINDREGDGPAYVTNPGKYLANIADGVVGDYISGTQMGFLCSPFQAQLKIALVQQYTRDYQPQCTLKDIGVNLEKFYESFDEGGWGAWFAVTQNSNNNPYGSYVNIQADIDSRLANALSIAQDQMNINFGFKSTVTCEATNPSQEVLNEINFRLENGETEAELRDAFNTDFNLNLPAGACIREGGTKTPGYLIATALEKQVNVGGEQLITAKNIDDLINAVMAELLSETVFSKKGLIRDDPYQEAPNSNYPSYDDSTTTCAPNLRNVRVNQDVTWEVKTDLSGTITTKWYGDDLPIGGEPGGTTLLKQYATTGNKSVNVDVFKDGALITNYNCSPQVVVSDVSCSPSATTVRKGESVVWTANNGTYPAQLYKWTGDVPASATSPSAQNKTIIATYNTLGTKNASASFYINADPDTQPMIVSCTSPVTVVDFEPITISCAPSVSTAQALANVHWTAVVKGGSGKFKSIEWGGGELTTPLPAGVAPGSVNISIWPIPSQETITKINENADSLKNLNNPSNAWVYGPRSWGYTDLSTNTQYTSSILFSGTLGQTNLDVTRKYFATSTTPYTATLKVIDAEGTIPPVTQACTGGITITP